MSCSATWSGLRVRAERLDVEDVRGLPAHHTRLRSELERYGGMVEKFIGDAVMHYLVHPSRMRTTWRVP